LESTSEKGETMGRSLRKKSFDAFGRATLATGVLASALLLKPGAPARADESLVLASKIDVGGKGLGAFDISFVDPTIDLYTLSDRTNASIDFIDASGNKFLGRIGGFKGVVLNPDGTANNNLSGPDGNLIAGHRYVWAGDGDSTVKVIDLKKFQIVDTISTGGKFRADEMGYDARDHIIAVANDADTPPFITLIDTETRKILNKVPFDGTNGSPIAVGGIEQTQWSPKTGLFYTSVPQIDASDPTLGGVAVIDPHSMSVTAVYPVKNCTPAGLALGPRTQALLGCSASFGMSPNVLTQSVVMDITNGNVVVNITQVGGSDQVWYDSGSQHYYLAARSNTDNAGKVIPVLGTIDAKTNTFDGNVSTSTTAHSVAADKFSLHVFVPIGFVPPGSPSGTDSTNPCPMNGCIAIYLPSASDNDDGNLQARR
jgi:hypothetical protein